MSEPTTPKRREVVRRRDWLVALGFLLLAFTNGIALKQQHDQSTAAAETGKQARKVQCQTMPIARKWYADALHRSVITQAEYDFLLTLAPACAKERRAARATARAD